MIGKIFDDIVTKVADITEIDKQEIYSKSKVEGVVKARAIAIVYLCEFGFSVGMIARKFDSTERNVTETITNFHLKKHSFIVEICKKEMRKYIDDMRKQILE